MKRIQSFVSKGFFASVAALFAVTVSAASVQDAMTREAIEKRIKPIGQHYVAGESSDQQASADGPRSGEDIYNTYCSACHTSGVMGSPKINNAADWEPRLEQGMETVLRHAVEGYNAMPPKGTCSDCSEDEIQAAIDYMIADI
ncbi:cytochrome c5 family protein [Idiomarina seosinensis]|uniref:c-type cytochrome n=1 Tax=Idiomarina seosinensis TaxID=281739 RepID=UPI003850BAF3